ncbi:MAG: CDP-diacylglycerol--glycerol-3-phosphate 3-phosphatidyltransferase [Deltaproteobacteria bacterium]|nr:CDP-diacylglycerol--glycerol-3-phosphate 3-phosphatidyltransferase [Deltaproteobacteria bacterium]
MCRILSIPLVIVCLQSPGKLPNFLAAIFFIVGAGTDVLDGYLARRRNIVTKLGKLLDPLADKLLVSAGLIMLIPLGRVPAWAVFVIIAREISVTGLRAIAGAEGIVIQAESLGKIKTLAQTVATAVLMIHYQYFHLDFHYYGMILFIAAFILTVWSGVSYFKIFLSLFHPTTGQD